MLTFLRTLFFLKIVLKVASIISILDFLLSHWPFFTSVYSQTAFGTIFRIKGGFRNNF
jgi:hypothetical protein